jgi:EAL domain-containing protein (putative c-di-GMP-specific phosphodiesterase class I)
LRVGTIAVNVSAIELRNENFLEELFSTLSQTGLDPRSLELEVTESALMKNSEIAASILQNLREAGVRIAIDDFGSGYSSLSYLRKFPLDALKIDQSFIRQLGDSSGEATIVGAIISMGRSLHLRVIADGVETAEDLAFLKEYECDEAQGYYFSRPVHAEQFAALLKTERSNHAYQTVGRKRKLDAGKDLLEAPIPAFDIENLNHQNLESLRLVARDGSAPTADN